MSSPTYSAVSAPSVVRSPISASPLFGAHAGTTFTTSLPGTMRIAHRQRSDRVLDRRARRALLARAAVVERERVALVFDIDAARLRQRTREQHGRTRDVVRDLVELRARLDAVIADDVLDLGVLQACRDVGLAAAGDHRARVQAAHLHEQLAGWLAHLGVGRPRDDRCQRAVEVEREQHARPRQLRQHLEVLAREQMPHAIALARDGRPISAMPVAHARVTPRRAAQLRHISPPDDARSQRLGCERGENRDISASDLVTVIAARARVRHVLGLGWVGAACAVLCACPSGDSAGATRDDPGAKSSVSGPAGGQTNGSAGQAGAGRPVR